MTSDRKEQILLELAELLGIPLILRPSESGRRWVDECVRFFEDACGLGSVRNVSGKQLPYDLLVCGKKVQCKSRSPDESLSVKIRNSHRATGGWYAGGEVDFFAIAYGTRHFVFPYSVLQRPNGTFRNDISVDRLWRYENAWDISKTSHGKSPLPLFGDDTDTVTQ